MTTTIEPTAVMPSTPPPRRSGSRALIWTGGIIGGLMLLSGAWSALGLFLSTTDNLDVVSGTDTYDAAPVVELVADGDVTVTTGGSQVVVDHTSRSAFVTPTYSAATSGDRLLVTHRCDWWTPSVCSASLDVQVPSGTEVVIRTTDGDVSARELTGPLETHVGDGRTSVNDVRGDVRVSSTDGRVAVSDVRGAVDARSFDGSVTVSAVTGRTTIRSTDGDVEVSDAQGDVDVRSFDGDVTVYTTGEPVALEIQTADGRQTVEAPTDPSADVHVRIQTTDGDASLLGPRH